MAMTSAERNRRYRERHPERARAIDRTWWAAHREQKRAYDAARYGAIREKALAARADKAKQRLAYARLSLGGMCRNCRTTENLDFHHIKKSTKARCVASLAGNSDTVFWNEVKKCELLCHRCHRSFHDRAARWAACGEGDR